MSEWVQSLIITLSSHGHGPDVSSDKCLLFLPPFISHHPLHPQIKRVRVTLARVQSSVCPYLSQHHQQNDQLGWWVAAVLPGPHPQYPGYRRRQPKWGQDTVPGCVGPELCDLMCTLSTDLCSVPGEAEASYDIRWGGDFLSILGQHPLLRIFAPTISVLPIKHYHIHCWWIPLHHLWCCQRSAMVPWVPMRDPAVMGSNLQQVFSVSHVLDVEQLTSRVRWVTPQHDRKQSWGK